VTLYHTVDSRADLRGTWGAKNGWRDLAPRVDLTAYPFGGLQILNGQVFGSWPPVVPATPLLLRHKCNRAGFCTL